MSYKIKIDEISIVEGLPSLPIEVDFHHRGIYKNFVKKIVANYEDYLSHLLIERATLAKMLKNKGISAKELVEDNMDIALDESEKEAAVDVLVKLRKSVS